MAELVNLTSHPIRIFGWDVPDRFTNLDDHKPTLVVEPSGQVARIGEIELGTQAIGVATPVEYVEYRHANGLPPLHTKRGAKDWDRPPVFYIVSLALALAQAGNRTDLLVPFREIRDLSGSIIGCRSLARCV